MIIVGGFGRCGTGLITGAISQSNYTFIGDLNDKGFWYQHESVCKTHSLPPKVWPAEAKVLWCFGNPMNTVVSCVKAGEGFLKRHAENLGADPNQAENIFYEDVLGLDKHFSLWYNDVGVRMATVKYEAMFDNRFKIQRFVGLPMVFPKFRERQSDWKSHLMAYELEVTYGSLAAKIEQAEDFKIW